MTPPHVTNEKLPRKKGGDCKWSPVGHSFFARIYLVTVTAKKKKRKTKKSWLIELSNMALCDG